jgi:hypothetical protein
MFGLEGLLLAGGLAGGVGMTCGGGGEITM